MYTPQSNRTGASPSNTPRKFVSSIPSFTRIKFRPPVNVCIYACVYLSISTHGRACGMRGRGCTFERSHISFCMCMSMCVCRCIRACVHVCVYICTCMYACMYMCMCVRMHVCVCMHVCLCVYVCIYVCVCVCAFKSVCVHVYAYVCVRMCVYVCFYWNSSGTSLVS